MLFSAESHTCSYTFSYHKPHTGVLKLVPLLVGIFLVERLHGLVKVLGRLLHFLCLETQIIQLVAALMQMLSHKIGLSETLSHKQG